MQIRILLDDEAILLPDVSAQELAHLLNVFSGAVHQQRAVYPRNGWTSRPTEISLQFLVNPAAEETSDE